MFSAAVDTIIEEGRIIKRTLALEIRNGFAACDAEEYTWVPVIDFDINVTENVPTIGSMRASLAIKDFEYFDEFDHEYYDTGNAVMLYAEARLQCTIYLGTGTGLAGTITVTAGNRTVTGAATAFLADFVPGDQFYVNTNPELLLMVWDVINNTTMTVYEIPSESVAGAAYSVVDAEREYIFRGFITDRQIVDKTITVECYDWLQKLQTCLTNFNLEADYVTGSPFANAVLQREPVLDAGTNTIFEIDPILHPWAENPSGLNRVFVPAAFEVEELIAAVWTLIEASEYQVIETLGLIEFKEDRGALPVTFRIVSVSVYQEGTLELEDIYTEVLTGDSTIDWPDCLNLSCGFDDTDWREALPGTFSFINGNTAVTGVGNPFADVTAGDRIAHNATPTDFGIVAVVTDANNIVLEYPYPGGTAGPLAGFKSTLRWSGLSITKVEWQYCDGTAANLMRLLQRDYADVRGYRIWYDPMDDVVRGDRVVIRVEPDVRIMDAGLIGSLMTDITSENFYSAVAVTGTIDRAKNYITDALVTTILDAEIAGWLPGTSKGGFTSYGNMTWSVLGGAGNAELGLRDTSIENAYPLHFIYADEAASEAGELTWYDYITIDLGIEINLGDIILYNINCKNEKGFTQGIWLQYSTDGVNFYDILTCYQLEFNPDERKTIDASQYVARHIKIKCRPFKWPSGTGWSGTRIRTIGLREIIIFGSEDICEMVCVQNGDIAGGRTVGGVFISDYYPEIIKKLCNIGHQVLIDDSGLVLSNEEAIDRGYLLLNEYIRLYRQISWSGAFDPRIQIYRTVHTRDVYREGGTDELFYICENYNIDNESTSITGREYGGGVLAPNYS